MDNNVFELPEITLELPSGEKDFTFRRMGLVAFPSGGGKIRGFLKQYNTAVFADNLIDLGDIAFEQMAQTPNIIRDLLNTPQDLLYTPHARRLPTWSQWSPV